MLARLGCIPYMQMGSGKWEVVSGNSKVASSDTVPIMSLAMSGTTYGAILRRGQDSILLLSGKEQVLPMVKSAGYLALSADGKRFALFVEQSPGKFALDVDGKLDLRQFDEPKDIKFSPDGKRLAYVARSGKDVIGLEYGSETEVRHPIFPPQFSADSHHVAWVMAEAPGHIKMLVDGKGSQTFRATSQPVLSDDGGQIGFLAMFQGKKHVFRNDIDEGVVAENEIRAFTFAP